jgi:hypothetical protein
MDAITIDCPACHGSGTQTNAHRSGDPQLETVGECEASGCEGGRIIVTAEHVEELIAWGLFVLRGPLGIVTDGMAKRGREAMRAAGIEP